MTTTMTTEQNGASEEKRAAPTAIVKAPMAFASFGGVQIRSFDDLVRFSNAAAASGYFKNVTEAAQAMMKVQWGAELGLPPLTAMQSIDFIDGKLSLAGALIAARIQATGTERSPIKTKYRYRVLEHTIEMDRDAKGNATGYKSGSCRLEWTMDGDVLGESSYTLDEAKLAGLAGKHNWKAHPKWMLFWRALSGGGRMFAPEVMFSIYTPEELNPELVVDPSTGQVLDWGGAGTRVVESAPAAEAPKEEPKRKRSAKSSQEVLEKALAKADVIDAEVVEEPKPEPEPEPEAGEASEPESDDPGEDEPAPADEDGGQEEQPPAATVPKEEPAPVPTSETASPGPTGEGRGGGERAQLLEALRSMPDDLQKMSAHVSKSGKGLSERDARILRMYARSVYNLSRGQSATETMSEADVSLYEEAMKLLGDSDKKG